MQDWGEGYKRILLEAGLWISLLKIYVDDGRQVTTTLKKGMRYDKEGNEFRWTEEAEEQRSEEEGGRAKEES